jgi:fructokinase
VVVRIGIDFGGTKIEAAALDSEGNFVARERIPNPGQYRAAVDETVSLVGRIEDKTGNEATVGVGLPGSISPRTGRMRNANSTWLNDQLFREDLSAALGREVRMTNDADCFALSEAVDGAGAGAKSLFGVIIGTGVGGGVVVNGQLLDSPNDIAGEWGHTPLPWPSREELGATRCWCGREGCLETWISGTGFSKDHERTTGKKMTGTEIEAAAKAGDADARASLERYVDRLGRGLAVVCDILDPAVIVLGGGMSNVEAIYAPLPDKVAHYAFTDVFTTSIVKAKWGDSSGVRGAAWLWPL